MTSQTCTPLDVLATPGVAETYATLPGPFDEDAVVKQMAAVMETEALAQSEPIGALAPPPGAHDGLYAPTPLDDLRARLVACVAAGVTVYRDGPLEIRFDPDARKAAKKQDAGEVVSF